uniref:Serum response factor-binding protein 1 n=1 Tax=Caenorhabditis tropicalis TaxID=1561998 RepID=A0A1I7V1D1_9PELO
MKKKIIKKKPAPPVKDSLELPMSRGIDDDDDVAEDYQVVDMSNVAAPVIEFEMPNLTEKPKPEKSNEKTVLTAEKLNNELVGLRATILKAKNQLMSKLVRQKKELEAKTKMPEMKGKEEKERKVARILEEILALKSIDKDMVAKFSAINTKTLNELKINGKTPVEESLMFKVACQEVVVNRMNEIRQKYVEWNTTAAFFMQRLGQQYANKPEKEVKKEDSGDEEDPEEADDSEEAEESEDMEDSSMTEEVESNEVEDGYDESDVEMVDSDEEEGAEAAIKRRGLLLGMIEKPKEEVLKKKKKKAVTPKKVESKEEEPEEDLQKTLVMKVDLSKGGKIAKTVKTAPAPKKQEEEEDEEDDDESTSFFLPKSSKVPPKRRPKEEMEVTKKGRKPAPPPATENKRKGSSKSTTTDEMHPSWVASQLKKKQLAAAKPAGKKKTFDDDSD